MDLGRLLVDLGATRLLFATRETPAPEVLRGVLELQRRGVSCLVVRADATDPKDLEMVRSRLAREGMVSGVVLRHTPVPIRLERITPEEALAVWRRSVGEAEALLSLAPTVPFWFWSEARGLEPGIGGGVGAIAAAAIGARLEARRLMGRPTAVVHAAPSTTLGQGQAARLVLRLGCAGGVYGSWRA